MKDDLIERLEKRAVIRRAITTRKSVQEGKPDRIADLLEEAAAALRLKNGGIVLETNDPPMWEHFCPSEGCDLFVEKHHACNWCGKEDKSL